MAFGNFDTWHPVGLNSAIVPQHELNAHKLLLLAITHRGTIPLSFVSSESSKAITDKYYTWTDKFDLLPDRIAVTLAQDRLNWLRIYEILDLGACSKSLGWRVTRVPWTVRALAKLTEGIAAIVNENLLFQLNKSKVEEMTDKQQTKTNTTQKAQDKKLSPLQPLSLKHLDGVAGGQVVVWAIWSCRNEKLGLGILSYQLITKAPQPIVKKV